MKQHEINIEISKSKTRIIMRLMKKTEVFTKLIRDIEQCKTTVSYAEKYLSDSERKELNKLIELQKSINF